MVNKLNSVERTRRIKCCHASAFAQSPCIFGMF